MSSRAVPFGLVIGIVAGLVPFVFSVSGVATVTDPGGRGQSCTYTDFIALLGGVIAVLTAGATIVTRRGSWATGLISTPLRCGLGAVILALGAFHVLRGLGIILSPCG